MAPSSLNKAQDDATGQEKAGKPRIAELKNGKVVFKQKPMSLEKNSETMQGVVKCREHLEKLSESQEPMFTVFPSEHMPVIAKLAHESDKTLAALAKHIVKELTPAQDDEDDASSTSMTIPTQVIETAIRSTLDRNNYGLEGQSDAKLPASICVWRWEVKEEYKDWLPKSIREKAEARKAERKQAKEDLRVAFEALSQNERASIIPSKNSKSSLSESNSVTVVVDLTTEDSKPAPAKQKGKAKTIQGENDKPSANQSPENEPVDEPEKTAKERARLEKKAAREEREKKEKESQSRSRSLMANFFSKTKAKSSTSSPSKMNQVASTSQTDFDRIFKPFVVKKDAAVAPTNWFQAKRRIHSKNAFNSDVIVITDDEDEGKEIQPIDELGLSYAHLERMSPQERLHSVIQSMPASRPRPNPSLQYKTYHSVSVRDVMNQLSEAEVVGDDVLVRSLISKLQDRSLFPAKVLMFEDDLRPGYFGTFTRNSRVIGPRTPLAKDMALVDYSYDSGEEWEAESPNDADDVNDDGEEDEGSESADSDLESWLVDDEEEEAAPMALNDDPLLGVDFPPPLAHSPPKRKAEEPPKKKLAKKRKVVVPLVPYTKGPCWESTIGHCDSDVLKPYRIQLFNDTPFAIDPFTFTSSCLDDYASVTKQPTKPTTSASSGASLDSNLMPPPPAPPTSVKRALKPKTVFPDAHLPLLLSKITTLQAPTITYLVDGIFKDLRSQNVKKNSIEAKVREVSEKCKEKKYWVVKPEILQANHMPNGSVLPP